MTRQARHALFWGLAAATGVAWLVGLGLSRVAVGQEEPQPGIPWSQQKSGLEYQSASNRARQRDLTANPGMLWVDKGAELWAQPAGASTRSCRDCHGEPERMKGVATRYPHWNEKRGRLESLETRIQACRTEQQGAAAPQPESEELLALSALVAHQSLDMPMAPSIDGPARRAFELGRILYNQRVGQLNMSCAHCHESNWGRRLRTEPVSQGQSNGYPIYRLEWQKLGSLHRRLRTCYLSVRSEPPAHGSDEHLALELYLAWRARGLPVETPALRR